MLDKLILHDADEGDNILLEVEDNFTNHPGRELCMDIQDRATSERNAIAMALTRADAITLRNWLNDWLEQR